MKDFKGETGKIGFCRTDHNEIIETCFKKKVKKNGGFEQNRKASQ